MMEIESQRPPQENRWKVFYIISGVVALVLVILNIIVLGYSADASNKYEYYHPLEPNLPGYISGQQRPHIVLAQDIDYPPYAYLGDATKEFSVDGFGHDVAMGLKEVCDIDITVVETRWTNCWDNGEIGTGLLNSWFHGCMTYTHTVGQRNRFMEFSEPILNLNKPAGIITRLDAEGKPHISPTSNLNGLKIVDVIGWAPTADGLHFVANSCSNDENFSGFEIIPPSVDGGNANDDALKTVLSGDADGMWVYADQAKNYKCSTTIDTSGWDCTLWEGLGTDFAYIHTGQWLYAYGGTTLSIAKKGSGVKEILDPCIKKYRETKSYYEVCKENGLESSCYVNEHFPQDLQAGGDLPPYETRTKDLKTTCSDGYCPCNP